MKPAARLAGMGVTPIRVVSEGAPPDAMPLGLGEPTWPMAEEARVALAKFSGVCSYGPQVGMLDLRKAVAAYSGVAADDVVITNGTQEALFDLCQAYLDPGDLVLVPDPGFVGYHGVIRLAGAKVVPYALDEARGFDLDAAAFVAALDAHPTAKMAIIGHPANPTGGGASIDAYRTVAAACEKRGVCLISDEVYRELYLADRPPSLLDVSRYGFVVSSMSKGFGVPGLRIGWVIGKPEDLAPVKVIHGYAITSVARPAQAAGVALFEAADRVLEASRVELRARWQALEESMSSELGRKIRKPAGAFYHFLRLPDQAHADPMAHCLRMRDEAKVVVIPGIAFGERGRAYARLSFAALPEQIREGVRRIARFWR